jgi:hypothetical protein
MNESQLVRAIKAHIERGDKAKDKAEQHYISAGQYLKTLKEQHNGSWAEWEELLKDKIGIGKSRASELMQIADGTKTAAEVTAATTERSKRHRALSPLRNGEKKGEGTGTVVPVDKRTGADRKARRRPAKKTKSKPEATLDKPFDELFFDAAPIKAAPSEPEREVVRARQDIGPASTGEVERLRARVDELQAEKRQLEIKIVGLKSEIEELKAERDELRERNEVAKTRTDDGLDIPEFLRRSEQ